MDVEDKILGTNNIEDVAWLCSLSESELDLLISLKMLVIQRAKVIGHEELAKKFDLRMLRALGLILMEYVKEKVSDSSCDPGFANSATVMDNCNLLKSKVENIASIEELKTCIALHSKKRHSNRREEDASVQPDAVEVEPQMHSKRKR